MPTTTTKKPWRKDNASANEPSDAQKPNANSAPLIDELYAVRAEIKLLEAKEKVLTKLVGELGDGEHSGLRYTAKVTTTHPNRLDTKGLKEVLDEKLIEKFTKPGKKQTTITFKGIEKAAA